MTTAAAVAACLLLAGLVVFQVLLVCGVPLGRFAWGGQQDVLPPRLRVGSAVASVVYVVVGWVLVARAAQGAGGILGVVTWVVAGFFLLGTAGNLVSRSLPERLVMTPVAFALCALTVVVAIQD